LVADSRVSRHAASALSASWRASSAACRLSFHDVGRRRLDLFGALRAVVLDAVQFALRQRLLGEDVLQLARRFAQRELRLAQRAVEIGVALALGAHRALGLVEPRLGAGNQDADAARPSRISAILLVGRQLALALGLLVLGQLGQLLLHALLLLAWRSMAWSAAAPRVAPHARAAGGRPRTGESRPFLPACRNTARRPSPGCSRRPAASSSAAAMPSASVSISRWRSSRPCSP
jgi:hypothetical protein